MHPIRHHPYGYCNNMTERKLCQYTRSELNHLRQKNLQLLSNSAMVNTLPDKGAKLKEINHVIDRLLSDKRTISASDEITVDNTDTQDCPLSKKLDQLTVLTHHQGARKRSVDLANQQAYHHAPSHRLLAKRHKRPSLSIFQHATEQEEDGHSKVRMLSLDESMLLQQEQQLSVQRSEQSSLDYRRPSKHLLNSLNLPANLIQDEDHHQFEFLTKEDEEDNDNDLRMEID